MLHHDAVPKIIVMNDSKFHILQEWQRSNWVRLRTLVLLRWFAIVGQITAILTAIFFFELRFEYLLAALVIATSVFANLLSGFLFKESRRLSEHEATIVFVFDIAQLGLLLGITGGLNNPFALLILAPVTIASTALRRRSMIIVGLFAILIVSLVANFNIPIRTASGEILALSGLFLFGFWLALSIGVVFLAVYTRRVTTEMHAMGDALLATQMALAREQKLTDLGGVVAATAHELGTPLATIKLVSAEMASENPNDQDLLEDIELIREQAERCSKILRSMGRSGKNDLHLQNVPIEAVVKEAADPHIDRGKTVLFDVAPEGNNIEEQPIISRRPEVIHGLRNLVQNAVDFAEDRIEIAISWSHTEISVRITDDGPGFPHSVLGRIGDPFVGRRRVEIDQQNRPEYLGMGLGLFIAKTLLERSSATLTFSNELTERPSNSGDIAGASVLVEWKKIDLEVSATTARAALGENKNI